MPVDFSFTDFAEFAEIMPKYYTPPRNMPELTDIALIDIEKICKKWLPHKHYKICQSWSDSEMHLFGIKKYLLLNVPER